MMRLSPLGKELRKIRVDRDMKMATMAEMMGVSNAYVSAVETGARRPTVKFVRAAAAVLQVSELEKDNINRAYRKTLIDEFMDNLIDPI